VLGNQFVPAEITNSLALQLKIHLSLTSGKSSLNPKFSAQESDSSFALSRFSRFRFIALVENGVADVQYLIVQTEWGIEEAGLGPQDE